MADLARIKRNVAKMAGMNAPEADIDAYIASEGVTVDDVRAFTPTPSGAPAGPVQLTGKVSELPSRQHGSGYVEQGLSGVNEGIAGMLGMPVDLTTGAMNIGLGLMGVPQIDNPAFGSQSWKDRMTGVGAITPETDDSGKQIVRRIGEELGFAAIPVAGLSASAARPVAAIGKELALTAGSGAGAAIAEQAAPDNPYVEIAAQLLGAGGANAAIGAGKRLITPFPISDARRAAVDTMTREGVDLTAGQSTGSKGLQYAESELGGGRIGDITEQQAEQFTSATLRRAGVSANRATPEVVDAAFDDLGRQFDYLAGRSALPMDYQLGHDLGSAIRDYRSLVPESQRAPIVEDLIGDLVTATQGGQTVSGPAYQALRSRLDRLARGAKADPQLSDTLFSIRNALDDAVERYLGQTSPDDLGAWRQARNDYRNMLVIERAAQGAGENAALGIISPAALRTAAKAVYGKRSYVRGNDPFAELAQAGQATMSPLPQSGTAPRMAVRTLGFGIPGALGAVLGEKAMPGMGAILGMAGGAAIPPVAGRALLSSPARAYLGNRLLDDVPSGATGIGPAAGVVTGQTSEGMLSPRQMELARLLAAAS